MILSQSDGLPFLLNALVYILLLEAVIASLVKFTKWLADEVYPHAEKIIMVCDNLNTHNKSSFYEAFQPAEALRLARWSGQSDLNFIIHQSMEVGLILQKLSYLLCLSNALASAELTILKTSILS